MEAGIARIHGTGFGFLALGLSWQPLFFRPDLSDREMRIMDPSTDHRAYLCGSCGALLVCPPDRPDDFDTGGAAPCS